MLLRLITNRKLLNLQNNTNKFYKKMILVIVIKKTCGTNAKK